MAAGDVEGRANAARLGDRPGVDLPSPQLIDAVKSLGNARRLLLVNVATRTLVSGCPSTAVIGTPAAEALSVGALTTTGPAPVPVAGSLSVTDTTMT